jgi:hypothetical protein
VNWLKKLNSAEEKTEPPAGNRVQVQTGQYEQKVTEYLVDLAYRSESRQQELQGYNPNLEQIRQELIAVDYPDPNGAIQAFQQEDYAPIYQVYRTLSEGYYNAPYNSPLRPRIEALKDEVRRIADWRDTSSFTQADAQQMAQQIIGQSRNRMQRMVQLIQESIARLQEWNGSEILVEPDDPPSSIGFNNPDWGSPITAAQVYVGQQTGWGGKAGFTLFGDWDEQDNLVKVEVDDILEGGDTDFFQDIGIQSDYFALVSELKNPGRSQQQMDKVLTLYTARPVEHRDQFLNTTSIPPNLFLTSSYEDAEARRRDYNSKLDIWKVRIRARYVLNTMDSPGVRWYQVKAQQGMVPVESMRLIDAWEVPQ